MSSTALPLVMVLGASGMTGRSIVHGLLRSGSFQVAAVVRSVSKPIVGEFKSRGVTIHQLDLSAATYEQLKDLFAHVDFLISTLDFTFLQNADGQKVIFDAAKAAGVHRVVPNDFGPSAPKGAMLLNDTKLRVREYIRQIELPYTFIEIGYWMQLLLPFPADKAGSFIPDYSFQVFGTGDTPTAGTNLDHVGDHVARIIQDERTLNQTVFVWENEITQNEAWKLAERKARDWAALEKKRVQVSANEVQCKIEEAIATNNVFQRVSFEYASSLYVRGDNTVKNAVSLGALDFKELYPDVQAETFEEFSDTFYQNPPALYES